jgi:hypothetical protein
MRAPTCACMVVGDTTEANRNQQMGLVEVNRAEKCFGYCIVFSFLNRVEYSCGFQQVCG